MTRGGTDLGVKSHLVAAVTGRGLQSQHPPPPPPGLPPGPGWEQGQVGTSSRHGATPLGAQGTMTCVSACVGSTPAAAGLSAEGSES